MSARSTRFVPPPAADGIGIPVPAPRMGEDPRTGLEGLRDELTPEPLEERLGEPLEELWRERLRRHLRDSYAGVRMAKFPEDLRLYEHILWNARPEVVIELGSAFGGSALWFRDRLRALAAYGRVRDPRVIAVDLTTSTVAGPFLHAADPEYAEMITVVEGDVRDPDLPLRVAEMIGWSRRCLIVEDSAHTFETTMASLRGFSPLVPPGGFFLVEDGVVDVEEVRIDEDWPRGVLPALEEWLASEQGAGFVVRRDLEVYGVTSHPAGILQRVAL